MMGYLSLIKYGLPALLLVIVGVTLHNWRVDSLRLKWQSEISAAVEDQAKKCIEEKVYAKESQYALQTNLDVLAAEYQRLLKANADLRATDNSPGGNDATGSNKPAGLTLEQRYLNDKQAAQLVACQGLVTHIYRVNHQEALLPAE